MDQFALIVKNYHRHLEKYSPTVKVAIIDDEIDPFQANLQENIDGGTSFHHRPGRPDRPVYYWSAPGGHGTEMAKLICRICPKACLCIIHLDEGLGKKEARQIQPGTAIEAIKWATTAGVHIISMSWSINQSKVSGDLYNDFQNFIRAMYDKGITMFCAASDHGNTSVSLGNNDLPAAFSNPLKTGAATVDGKNSPRLVHRNWTFISLVKTYRYGISCTLISFHCSHCPVVH
ncbi:major intracellular serine protease [Aspergillus awamori]|uniref:Major intracellular serine protease n=1 Tax=Aspergillus awamori TaxID=105351 RepID=A0A401KSK7_ASPAW|nr:major intracellular serine protease [Aspergillus awamori]